MNACKSTKLVPQDKHLLEKNIIKTTVTDNNVFNKVISILDRDQAIYVKHKPNRKILVLGKFYLGLYNVGSSKKHPEKNDSTKWRKYLRNIGEAPILLDTNEIQKTKVNLKKYLINKGYLNCDIEHQVVYKKKKAIVTYFINPNNAFTIRKVMLFADDAEIDQLLNQNMKFSLLDSGNNLDIELISQERNRMTELLRNNGYFDFNKDYFDFELDTIKKVNQVDIVINVSNKANGDRFIKKKINAINVVFENDEETQKPESTIYFNGISFNFNGYPLKPYVIAKNITIKKDSLFSENELENSYAKLSELSIFKFIDITFLPNPLDTINSLNVLITLRTNLRQSFSIEPQGIISQLNRIQSSSLSSNSYGIANSLIWAHRNLFRNAELFEISSNTRMETQFYRDVASNQLFYTNLAIQQSLNASITIPKSSFLTPIERWKNVKSVKTNFNVSFLYELNPDYTRKILPLTYQYQIQSKRFTWYLNIAEISFSRNNLTDVNLFGRNDSAFITRIFQNNLITSSSLNFFFTNKNTTKSRSFFIVRANVLELGGNVHRLARRILDNQNNADTSYQLFNVNYFQYAKTEIDARCSTKLNENSSLGFRLNMGATYPYSNQKEVAFDKLYFIGGANSLRGWRPRTIGPGIYSPNTNNFRIDRAGDLVIQGSIEYRFDLIKNKLEGAFFTDAGNIWILRNENNVNPDKLFKINQSYKDIAANAGIGARIDFQFFLFRLDYGFQIHNPEFVGTERWVIKDFARNQYFSKYGLLNFGIGYPF